LNAHSNLAAQRAAQMLGDLREMDRKLSNLVAIYNDPSAFAGAFSSASE
jgi:hypothetical protein